MKTGKSMWLVLAFLISPVLHGAGQDADLKCPYFDFLVGSRTSVLTIKDSRMPEPVVITSVYDSRYGDRNATFEQKSSTSSPSAPGTIMKAQTIWIRKDGYFLGTVTDAAGNKSTVKLYIIDASQARGEMFSGEKMFTRWRSKISGPRMISEGEFLDPAGAVIATSLDVTE